MFLKTNKAKNFYLTAGLFVATGWLWFLWMLNSGANSGPSICFFRNITGLPCPSCGSTTSLKMIAAGDWQQAFFINPLGYIIGIGMLVLPSWMLFDLITQRNSAQQAFLAFDRKVKRRPLILLFILLPVMLNWIWNLIKM
jgi:hypothetical protein